LCHLQHKLIGFYNRDEKCLQRGTEWVFKYSGLRFVCKWFTSVPLPPSTYQNRFYSWNLRCRGTKRDRQCAYNVTWKRVRVTIVAVWKAISSKCNERVSVFLLSLYGLQIASFLRRVILTSVACPAVRYSSTLDLYHKRHYCRKKKKRLLNTKCVFWFSL